MPEYFHKTVGQAVIGGIICLALFSTIRADAAILLTEDWNDGTFNADVWNKAVEPLGRVEVVEVGVGDHALALWDNHAPANGLSQWNVSVTSRQIFPRAGNTRVRLKVWSDLKREDASAATSQCLAGWHLPFYELATYFTQEAALNTFARYSLDENRGFGHARLPDNDAFDAAFNKAVSKETALALRVTLGERTGAMLEWHDGAAWRASVDTRNTQLDADPLERGSSIRKDDFGNTLAAGVNIGSSPWARLGFVPASGWLMVDDIVVENDLSETEAAALMADAPTFASPPAPGRPWTHLKFNNDPQNFQFVITSDLTGGYRPGVWEDAVRKTNLLQPEFVITVGDLVEGYVENRQLIERQFQEFDRTLKPLTMPFFYVAGNHDISNAAMGEVWREHYGREYYHFVYKDVLFLCMQSNDGAHYGLSSEQIDYFRRVLRENPDARWTNVFIHDPMWLYDWETGWGEFESLLQGRPYSVFAGHVHLYAKMERHNQDYYILATTGGSSTLGGAKVDGQFDHVMWVTMSDEGPTVLNITLDGMLPGDVRHDRMEAVREQLEVKRRFMEGAAKRLGRWKE